MMKRWIALAALLLVLAVCAGALADGAQDLARTETEEALAQLREDLTGWQRLMALHAEIGEITEEGKELTVTVRLPAMLAPVPETGEDAAKDPTEELRGAMKPLTDFTLDTELTLRADPVTRNGETSLNWRAAPLRAIRNRLGQLETAAVKAMNRRELKALWEQALLPDVAEMPRKQPEEAPAMALPQQAADAWADALAWEGNTAERLAPLMLLASLDKLTVQDGPEAAKVTLEVKDWAASMDEAAAEAKTALDALTGVPDMADRAVEDIYLSALRSAAMQRYYKKRSETVKLTVNLLKAVAEGPEADPEWLGWVRNYADSYTAHLDDVLAYARSLPYYPRVPQIDSRILYSAEEVSGSGVSFSLQDGGDENAYLVAMQGKKEMLRLYLHSGDRMNAVLPTGHYTVYITMGPEWFGYEVLFGKDAYYGVFDLEIEGSMRYSLSLADRESGNVPAEDIAEADFRAAVPGWIPEAE